MAKTTAAMRRKRQALAVPDVWVLRPPYANQFLALRLKRGRKVLQRTLTRDETEFLVWTLAWYMFGCTEGVNSPEEALLHAFKRGRAPWNFVESAG